MKIKNQLIRSASLFAILACALSPVRAWSATVAELQQQLQQAQATEARANTKWNEERKSFETAQAAYEASRNTSKPLGRPIQTYEIKARAELEEAKKKRATLEAELAQAAKTTQSSTAAQSPKAPETNGKAATADEVIVPNLAVFDGLSEMQGVARHAGLVPRLVATKATPPPNSTRLLADQNPKPGTKAKKGDALQIIIYQKAAGTVDMPDLRGLTLEQATTRLPSNMTIAADEVGDKPPTPEQALTIFSQTPSPNTMFPPDKQVVVAVKRYGSGKPAEPEPTPSEDTSTSSGTGAVSTDIVGEFEGMVGEGKNRTKMTVSISREGDGYMISAPGEKPQRLKIENGSLVQNFDLDFSGMLGSTSKDTDPAKMKMIFTISGNDLNVDLSSTTRKSGTQKKRIGTLRRKSA